jgi:hypothetical protein
LALKNLGGMISPWVGVIELIYIYKIKTRKYFYIIENNQLNQSGALSPPHYK